MNYQDFELEISKNGTAGDYVVKVRAPEGQEAKEYFTLPAGVILKNLILTMCSFSRSTRAINSPETQAACELGGVLFDNVFKGEIGNLFKSCLDHPATDSGLRIKLILQDAPELSTLPWEFLYDSKKRSFLAHTQATSIVRYLQLPDAIKPLEVTPPFKLLVASASPSDFGHLNLDKEQEELKKAFDKLEHEGIVQVTWLEHATVEKLATAFEEQNFHWLHFMGHSGFDDKFGEGVLVLEDESGRGDYYGATHLRVLLQDYDSLRLVVLNSCSGAKQEANDPFSSIATTLILGGIPAVIAMQFDISDQAAIGFAETFYKHLAKGDAVDKAMAETRKHLYAVKCNNVEWGTPVLYLRAKDGVLFQTTQTTIKHVVNKKKLDVIEEEKIDETQQGLARLLAKLELNIDKTPQGLARLKEKMQKGLARLLAKLEEKLNEDWQLIGKYKVKEGLAVNTETGLMWLRFAYGQKWQNATAEGEAKRVDWETASKVVKTFNEKDGYEGYSDWRLPTVDELKTLIDRTKGKEGNYIDADVFPNNDRCFWSSESTDPRLVNIGTMGADAIASLASFATGSFLFPILAGAADVFDLKDTAQFVDFNDGISQFRKKDKSDCTVRLVRGGQQGAIGDNEGRCNL